MTDTKAVEAKKLFCYKLLDLLYQDKYIINIDEWGFSHSLRQNYSWLPKGVSSTIINKKWKGRTNLVLAISTDGDFIGILTDNSTNAEKYCAFLLIIMKVLSSISINIKEDVIILQD